MFRTLLLIITILIPVAGHCQKTDYKARIKLIYGNIREYLSSDNPDLFLESTDTLSNRNPYSYLWPVCALFQAANEMEILEPETDYLHPLLKTLSYYYDPSPPAPGYRSYIIREEKDTRYYDDNQWLGITAMDAFSRTGKKEFLDLAKTIYRFMMTGYDTISGGGIYWREGDKTTKNTCSNGPGIILALRLYMATGEKDYLNTAYKLYEWVNRYLRSPDGTYWDALKVNTMKIDSAKYTYNTGTMLQSNVLLYLITGENRYLDEAKLIALSAEKHFYRNNRLPNNLWFNAVMLRGFIELSRVDGNYDRLRFFADDAERVWTTQRDEKGFVGRRPGKTLIDQAAMIEIFARLQQVQEHQVCCVRHALCQPSLPTKLSASSVKDSFGW